VQNLLKVKASINEVCASTHVRYRWSCILAHSSGTILPKHYSACMTTGCQTSDCGCVGCCLRYGDLCTQRTRHSESYWKSHCTPCMQMRRIMTSLGSVKRYTVVNHTINFYVGWVYYYLLVYIFFTAVRSFFHFFFCVLRVRFYYK